MQADEFSGTFEEMAQRYMDSKVLYGSYWTHLKVRKRASNFLTRKNNHLVNTVFSELLEKQESSERTFLVV